MINLVNKVGGSAERHHGGNLPFIYLAKYISILNIVVQSRHVESAREILYDGNLQIALHAN